MIWSNVSLKLAHVNVVCSNLPQNFDGFRIAHVSDLHNTQFGKDNSRLIGLIGESDPDMIAITGDIISSYDTDIDVAVQFAREAAKIAPCYYVPGNHEARITEYGELVSALLAAGVKVLSDSTETLCLNGQEISVIGVLDPLFSRDSEADVLRKITSLSRSDEFTILLSHRPELFETYVSSGVDLVLSGHAHGGQFRLPVIGAVFAPNQGFFPEYTSGLYKDGKTSMVVSRGLGNSSFPFRINNRPELVVIELSNDLSS